MDSLRALASRLPEVPVRKLLIGLSGGADSVALLRLLAEVRDGRGLTLCAVHVNHGLRGAESDGDEAFCRELCRTWSVPLTVRRLSLPENASENRCREARYAAFREALAESGCEALVLAHHREDQAETLLMRLLRGSGLRGLCGMEPDTAAEGARILRPLLGFSREELREALREAEQPWREDSSNRSDRYLRNRVRHELLPLMEELAPGAPERIARTASLLRADEHALEGFVHAILLHSSNTDWLDLNLIRQYSEETQTAILRVWWDRAAPAELREHHLNALQTERLLALAKASPGTWLNLPGELRAYRGGHCLHLVFPTSEPPPPEVAFHGEEAFLGQFRLRAIPFTGEHVRSRTMQDVPVGWPEGLTLRCARPGDWILPFGSGHRRELRDFFQERGVDLPFRPRIPLLCRGSEVLLAAGLGAGDVPPWRDGEPFVRMVWDRGLMPWAY